MSEERNEIQDETIFEQEAQADLESEKDMEFEELGGDEVCEETSSQEGLELTDENELQEINLGCEETEEEEELVLHKEDNSKDDFCVQQESMLKGKSKEELEEYYNSLSCERRVGVYVKTNSQGYIIDIKSDIFENNLEGYIKIDEGDGEKFVHAQTAYFEEPLCDINGQYRYKL